MYSLRLHLWPIEFRDFSGSIEQPNNSWIPVQKFAATIIVAFAALQTRTL
jgi:hypothetical protein